MHISNVINTVLAATFFCTPALTESGSIQIQETSLSTLAGSRCYTHQPDLSVGKVIYHKGQTTLNGSVPKAGTYLQNGDVLNTASDGFIALELSNGVRLSVQPATHLNVVCTAKASETNAATMHIPHLSGAVRG